jgi:hypothetical protein
MLRLVAQRLCHGVTNGTVFHSLDLAEIAGFSFVFNFIRHFRPAALELRENRKQFNRKQFTETILWQKYWALI